ncbi:SCO7613 C-terminal domain-containing membrane protein [Agromyces aurantiacus]|uniref:SCO7613 C-terminal domain-containing membrane protein n=1 Tax=Agromyces aurantiacus TaxID=165814 RepID=A0ABV9RA45_9MICO|nr:hypothetical protein [Agromyces aurantiacus]MBM7504964.1 hypothetical protein [Agromyces aurantiacus]
MSDPTRGAEPGPRHWPADPDQLVDTTRCPACFAPLSRASCDVCGLRLDVAAADSLLAAGARVRDAELERQALIARMRAEQAAAATRLVSVPVPVPVAVSAPTPSSVAHSPAGSAVAPLAHASASPSAPGATASTAASVAAAVPSSGSPAVPPAPPAAEGHGAPADATPARPRRSGVQLFLLTLGVVLLSVAAIVFLFVAYLVAELEVRSLITAVASVVVLGIAWLLRARRLPGTAEGVASVAVVLLLLDAWILRANELFDTERLEVATYWGGALLAVAAVLTAARSITGVRTPGLAAAALAPVGVFLLGVGAAPDDELGTALWVGGTAALVAGAVTQLVRPGVERAILVGAGAVAGAIGLVAAPWSLPEVAWGAAWAFAVVGAAWSAFTILRLRATAGGTDAWSICGAIAVGAAFALAPGLGAWIELDPREAVWLAPAAAGAVACAAAALTRRGAAPHLAWSAFASAAVIAGAVAMPAFIVPLALVADLPATVWALWSADAWAARRAGSALGFDELRTGAVFGQLAIAAGAVLTVAALGRMRRLASLPIALASSAALTFAVGAPTLGAVTAVLLAIALVALVLAAVPASRTLPGVRIVLAVFGITSAAGAWALGHAAVGLWWWIVPAVLLLAVTGRALATRIWRPETAPMAGALHVGIAAALAIVGAYTLPGWAGAAGSALVFPWDSGVFTAGLVSAALFAVAALLRRMAPPDRLAVSIPSFGAAVASTTILAATLEEPFGWVPAMVLVGAATAWLLDRTTSLRSVHLVAALASPFALAFAGAGLVAQYGETDRIALGLAAATLAAAGLANVLVSRDPVLRHAWAAAVGAMGAVILLTSAGSPAVPEDLWLVLLILTPVPMLIAALEGDPIGGDSPIRHLSWASLALAIASAWAWVAREGVEEVEPYTMPVAVGLLVAGGLIAWRRPTSDEAASGRTAVFAAAAAVAVLPSVAVAGDSELRTLILVAVGAIAILAGAALPERMRAVPVRLLVMGAGWTAVTGAGLVRGAAVALGEPSRLVVEFWPLLALAAGVVAVLMWARTSSQPGPLAEWGFAASLAAASVPTTIAIVEDERALLRAAVLLPVLAGVHVANAASTARPLAGPVMRWTSLATLVVVATVSLAADTVEPFDVTTVPAGLALVIAGAIRMRRDDRLRSWPALGPGLAVLLVPGLIADWTDPQLWRLVALGATAVAAVLVGALMRLQAPFVLGGAVLLVHALVQLWPWISRLYEAVWWWLWLGIAGAALIALAATYERQLRLARSAVRAIAALR